MTAGCDDVSEVSPQAPMGAALAKQAITEIRTVNFLQVVRRRSGPAIHEAYPPCRRVGAIRAALDDGDHQNTIVCSNAAKYASSYYSPSMTRPALPPPSATRADLSAPRRLAQERKATAGALVRSLIGAELERAEEGSV